MSPDDGRGRLLAAISSLAASAEPIQRRLEHAGLELLPLQAQDFTDPAAGAAFDENRCRVEASRATGALPACRPS